MSEIVQAWLYTADNKMGMFQCDFDAKLFMEGTLTDVEEATHGDDNVSSASPAPYGDTVVPTSPVDAITAHHIWVGFFLQTWQVWAGCCSTTYIKCTYIVLLTVSWACDGTVCLVYSA